MMTGEETRAALERVRAIHRPSTDHGDSDPYCVGCWEAGGMDAAPSWPCATIRALAPVPSGDAWECQHEPRCADAACSYNPAMQRLLSPAPAPSGGQADGEWGGNDLPTPDEALRMGWWV